MRFPNRRRLLTTFAASPVMPWSHTSNLISNSGTTIGSSATNAPLGIYISSPSRVGTFERWLGYPIDQFLIFTDPFHWSWIADPRYFIDLFSSLRIPALWSFAMIPKGATLESVSDGQHDADYRSAARVLANAHPHADGNVYVRIGWEFNGDWFPWSAAGHESAFISAFQHVVNSFRSIDARFRFEWNMNWGQSMNPVAAFPGASYVDVIGMDFYWMPQYVGKDPVNAFDKIANDRYGLRYLDTLAREYNKPIAFSEWGVTGNNAAPYINAVRDWIRARNVAYHNYWDSNAAYPGMLSNDAWPESGLAFRRAFAPARRP